MGPLVVWATLFGVGLGVNVDFVRARGLNKTVYLMEPILLYALLGALAGAVMGLVFDGSWRWRMLAWVGLGLLTEFVIEFLTGPLPTGSVRAVPYPVQLLIFAVEYIALTALLGEVAIRLIGGYRPLVGRLRWSWRMSRRTMANGLLVGVLLGAVFELPNWIFISRNVGRGVVIGSVFALVLGLLFAFSKGLRDGLLDSSIPMRIHPNDGLRRSARYGLTIGLVATVVIGALFFLGGAVGGWDVGVARAITWGPGAGLLWGFATGLGAVIQYFMLRALLWRYGLCPLHLGRWLEHLVRLRILYRTAGGGYAFLHQLVQDHFVATAAENRAH